MATAGEKQELRILVADDDRELLDSIEDYFTAAGFQVLRAGTGAMALELIRRVRLDCVVLDVGLPDQNGFDLCAQLRAHSSVPVIFLSCYTEEEHRVRGLSLGGDDYVCKPFSMKELELRVRARIRGRGAPAPPAVLSFGPLTIDTGVRRVTYGEKEGDFARIEFDILAFLAQYPGRVFSYEQIYDGIWQEPMGRSRHNLQARVASMRQKLTELCGGKNYVSTVRRKGYSFTP
ncbi:Transcriptional regulatory protein SrrA [Firmicutes bacterium ASF500]|nr:Transcriptional regulatory protein SrrA [Firmicutes bacterium ASF500]